VELTLREEATTVWEKGIGVSEWALDKVSLDLHVKRAKTEATQQEYLKKMCAHTAYVKHTLGLDMMLGGGGRRSYSLTRSDTSRCGRRR
jgi:TnpA family transposase